MNLKHIKMKQKYLKSLSVFFAYYELVTARLTSGVIGQAAPSSQPDSSNCSTAVGEEVK